MSHYLMIPLYPQPSIKMKYQLHYEPSSNQRDCSGKYNFIIKKLRETNKFFLADVISVKIEPILVEKKFIYAKDA